MWHEILKSFCRRASHHYSTKMEVPGGSVAMRFFQHRLIDRDNRKDGRQQRNTLVLTASGGICACNFST